MLARLPLHVVKYGAPRLVVSVSAGGYVGGERFPGRQPPFQPQIAEADVQRQGIRADGQPVWRLVEAQPRPGERRQIVARAPFERHIARRIDHAPRPVEPRRAVRVVLDAHQVMVERTDHKTLAALSDQRERVSAMRVQRDRFRTDEMHRKTLRWRGAKTLSPSIPWWQYRS